MGDEATAGRGLTANDGRRAMLDAGFDEADSVIVAELRRDGRATLSDLAKATSLSPSSVQSRIRKLERRGVLIGDRVQIDYHKAGLPISAFVSVLPLDYSEESEIPDRLRELEGVMSCYSATRAICCWCVCPRLRRWRTCLATSTGWFPCLRAAWWC